MPKDNARQTHKPTASENVNRLTLAFAKAVAAHQTDKDDNLVVSPYNALTCLAMAAKGADKNTREEMAQALFGVDGSRMDSAVGLLAALNSGMLRANKGQVELTTANGIWTNDRLLTLDKKFADAMMRDFDAALGAEDFSDPAVVKKINAWASRNTNGLIKDILDRLNDDDAAVLASALYFKGQWTHKFDAKETEDRPFTTDDGNSSVTPTMHKHCDQGEVAYKRGADYQAVALTYGEKNKKEGKAPTMRLVLIRPNDENVTARDWLMKQAGGSAPGWMDALSFSDAKGTVELPRLDIKQKNDLVPALRDMGIRDAFDAKAADFSPMTADGAKDLVIGKVSHDVVFKTDEKGSEAAAVTSVIMMRATSIPSPTPMINVKFDRSFVFALQDIDSGAIIFIGAVNKPNRDMKPAPKKERVNPKI